MRLEKFILNIVITDKNWKAYKRIWYYCCYSSSVPMYRITGPFPGNIKKLVSAEFKKAKKFNQYNNIYCTSEMFDTTRGLPGNFIDQIMSVKIKTKHTVIIL